MKVLQFPMVRITLWLVLGILFSYYTNLNPNLAFGFLFIAVIVFILAYFIAKKNLRFHFLFGAITYLVCFIIGASTQTLHNDFYNKSNYIHKIQSAEKEYQITAVIHEKLKANSYSRKYTANVKTIENQESSGSILLNFSKKDSVPNISVGNIIYLKGKIVLHEKPKNPDQFDYGNYLNQKSIFGQMYVSSSDYIVSSQIDKSIFYYANKIRDKMLTNLKNSGFHTEELNVVAALILGQKQDLSPEILQDYQFAGAIHILSVSGLHVGYLFLCLTFLLNFLPKSNKYDLLKLMVILISLWSFALLAGLSPSVVRSVSMFSILAIGEHLKSRTNTYNTLFVSMFFILLFEPAFVFDVGFQLSYAAVFFIIWLYPLISRIWTPKYKIIGYFWKILAVSLAAQIGTLPISLYYFHLFPTLFIITNLVVLPALGFIMILGVVVLLLAAFNFTPIILSKTLEFLITLLNGFIHWIASFRIFLLRDIPFNGFLLFSMYLLIILFFIWFIKQSNLKLKTVLISVLILQFGYYTSLWNINKNSELIVFNQIKETIIGEKSGGSITFISNDTIVKNQMLKSYLVAQFNPTTSQKQLGNLLYFNKHKILILDASGIYTKTIKPDIVLITKSPKINFERMLIDLQPKLVIADASNYKSSVEKWKKSCLKQKIPFHATSEKGFYKLK